MGSAFSANVPNRIVTATPTDGRRIFDATRYQCAHVLPRRKSRRLRCLYLLSNVASQRREAPEYLCRIAVSHRRLK